MTTQRLSRTQQRNVMVTGVVVLFAGLVVAFVLSRAGMQVVIGIFGFVVLMVLSTSRSTDCAAMTMVGTVGLSIALAWSGESPFGIAALAGCGVAASDIAALAGRLSGEAATDNTTVAAHLRAAAIAGAVAAAPVLVMSLFSVVG